MSFAKVLGQIEALPPPVPGEARVPPAPIVAFFVRTQRGLRRLKKEAFASMAGISLSSLERIERAKTVDPATLSKVEAFLGLVPGHITRPRAPLTSEELAAYFESTSKVAWVEVRPLNTQAQVRELAECHSYLPLSNVPQADCGDEVAGFIEWIDLVAFIRSTIANRPPGEKISYRELYKNILEHVKGMERQGYNVLSGTLDFPVKGIPEWRLAVIYVSTKKSDPSGQKRQVIPVDTALFPRKVTLADCARWIDDE